MISISTNILDMVLDLIHVELFIFPSGKLAQNVIIFGVDMSSSLHVDNKKKDILIIGEGPTKRLDGTILNA